MVKFRIIIGLLVLTALLGAGPHAHAENLLEDPDLSRYLRWGPFRVRPGFTVSDFGHDDNVFHSSSQPQDDLTIRLAPKLEGLLLLGDRLRLTFDEMISYKAYYKFEELNFLDHEGNYRLTIPLTNYGFFVDMENRRVHERPVDLEDTRAIRNSRKIGLGAFLQIGWRSSLELVHAGTNYRYEDEDFGNSGTSIEDLQNRDETAETVRFRYKAKGRTSLTLDFENRGVDFDNPFLGSVPGVVRNLDQFSIVPGVEFGKGGPLSGILKLGTTSLTYDDPTLQPYKGLVGATGLTYSFTGGTRVSLDAERRVDFSVWENNAYLLDNHQELTVVHFLNRFLGLELGYLNGKLEVPEPVAGDPREDDIRKTTVGLKLRMFENDLGRRVEYTIRYQGYRRTSSQSSLNQSRNTVSFTADLGF
jgi:hypothetical protein